jgi:DNA-binding NtrC family response regulator
LLPSRLGGGKLSSRTTPSSHRDLAAKALKKLSGPHFPASVKQLERAIDRVHAAHQQAIDPKRPQHASDEQDPTQGAGHETEEPAEGPTDEAHPADDPPPHSA